MVGSWLGGGEKKAALLWGQDLLDHLKPSCASAGGTNHLVRWKTGILCWDNLRSCSRRGAALEAGEVAGPGAPAPRVPAKSHKANGNPAASLARAQDHT